MGYIRDAVDAFHALRNGVGAKILVAQRPA